MHWGAKFKAALEGEVDATDVATLIAATRPLYTLQQQVSDRRLDLQLAHPQEPWLVFDSIGPLAAPLWIADTIVALAQSLSDASAEAHPQTPRLMSKETHEHALALLALVDPIMSEVSTALADPSYHMNLRMPIPIGIHGGFIGTLGFVPLDAAYLRGLVQGAERAQGAVAQAIQDYKAAIQPAGAPNWLKDGLQYLTGQIAAADVRLDSVHARIAPLLAHQRLDDDTLQQVIVESWTMVEVYTIAGQLALYPRLIPGTPPPDNPGATPALRVTQGTQGPSAPTQLSPSSAPDQPPSQAASSSGAPVRPAPMAAPEPPQGLPDIGPSGTPAALAGAHSADTHSAGTRQEEATPPRSQPETTPAPSDTPSSASFTAESVSSPTHQDARRSAAGEASRAQAPGTPGLPAHEAPRALPQIGVAAPATPAAPPAPPAWNYRSPEQAGPSSTSMAHALPEVGSSRSAHALPEIGPSHAAQGATPPTAPRTAATHAGAAGVASATGGRVSARRITAQNRWLFAAPETRHRLRTEGKEGDAEQALTAFWTQRDWTIYRDEEDYLLRVNALLQQGEIERTDRELDGPPFAAIYHVLADKVTIGGTTIPVDTLFSYNHEMGHVMIT